MKKITLSIIAISFASCMMAQTLDRSIRPKAGPAPEIKLGKTESFTLPNGLKVFVVENHKLPTIAASIQLDIQPELEGDMVGYKEMMSDLLTNGTKTKSKDQFNQELDFIGANLNASAEGISASGLKKYQDKILGFMADVAMNANITQTELDKLKTRTLSGLESSENDPDNMLNNVSAAINYGSKHPYGEIPTKESVKKITLERCKKYYSSYFRPNVAYMAIVGDVTVAEIKPLIEKYFGTWKSMPVTKVIYTNPTAPTSRRVIFVPRDAAVQSVINVTYPVDLKPGTPDVIKSRVANSILGGGSNGRLFLNLREQHGWTYGSYSSLNSDELKANFTGYAKCRNAVSDSSAEQILAEMTKLNKEKVGAEELQNHIVNMSGAFAIGLESPGTVAQYAINIERYKMPKDYYQNYLKNLAAVTADDIQAMAKKYINPDKTYIVVVGSKDEVAKTFERFDSDKKIEYFDPYGREVKQTASAAVPANMSGADVVKKYIAAIGGEKAIMAIKDIKTISKGELQGQTLTITEMKKDPSKMKVIVSMSGMVLQKIVLNGDKGYQEQQGQKAQMEAVDIADYKAQADIYADLHPEKYGRKYELKGMDKVNGEDAYKVEMTEKDSKKTINYYDAKTFYLVKEVRNEETPQGAVSMATEYSDYKEVLGAGGYKIPNSIKIPLGPGMSISSKVESVEVNKGIADTEFE